MPIDSVWLNASLHRLDVWTDHLGEPVHIGTLTYELETKATFFQWSTEAEQRHLNLSPLQMPLSTGRWSSRDHDVPADYHGLPGMLNDSLPDGWGLYLMDQALARQSIPLDRITPATRLAFLGDRTWGSLSFRPVIEGDSHTAVPLGVLGREMEATIEGHLDDVSAELLQAGSSPQGARPKVMVDCDASFEWARVSGGVLEPGLRAWIIKWASRDEPADAPMVEQVYMEVAADAGISVMPSRLLDIDGKTTFATERFDRRPTGRVFCQSLGALLHFSHRAPGLDYGHIANVMDNLGMPRDAFREAYKRAAFNAAMSVRDDHAKNVAFCMGADGVWTLAPAFDLTYMAGPNGYHTLTFADGTTRDPSRDDLLRLAQHYHLDRQDAGTILDAMIGLAGTAGQRCRGIGVSKRTIDPIDVRLKQIASSLK